MYLSYKSRGQNFYSCQFLAMIWFSHLNQNMCPIFFAAESPLQCWTIPGTGARQGPGSGCWYFQLQNFCKWVLQLHALQFRCQWWSGCWSRTKRLVRAGTLEWRISEYWVDTCNNSDWVEVKLLLLVATALTLVSDVQTVDILLTHLHTEENGE